jgi:hypothetical protein
VVDSELEHTPLNLRPKFLFKIISQKEIPDSSIDLHIGGKWFSEGS